MFLLKLAKCLHIIKSKKYKELRATNLFKKSNLFDRKWYIKTYPKAANSKISPETHYYTYGWKEGYNPSPLFDGNYYLQKYKDAKCSGLNPLEHYLLFGQNKGHSYQSVDGKTVFKPAKDIKKDMNLLQKVKYALEYPIRLQEECERLKAEINELEKQLGK